MNGPTRMQIQIDRQTNISGVFLKVKGTVLPTGSNVAAIDLELLKK